MCDTERKYACLRCDHNIPMSAAQQREGYVPTPQYCPSCKIVVDRELDEVCDEDDLHISMI